ncbi:helix-turn-helix domain-containing protein [Breznakia pachnodae]|uniref:Transcriptional regulator with XRE-family HTH domain n=1 Tax=Breznakia pachnodae TaxID=265178 RepID=A0ABU0E719_9FIRM|nr:helix-turn-helix transcriptional regulator [Breznakia pachnodae]MDQ0362498.1 transcriptional regulator with XRE-family HTH domain [Breznakia pachnodae]
MKGSNIKENLKNLRESRNLSKTKLAKEIGIDESIIRNIESGKSKNPTIETIANLCSYFSITIDTFMYYKFKKTSDINFKEPSKKIAMFIKITNIIEVPDTLVLISLCFIEHPEDLVLTSPNGCFEVAGTTAGCAIDEPIVNNYKVLHIESKSNKKR